MLTLLVMTDGWNPLNSLIIKGDSSFLTKLLSKAFTYDFCYYRKLVLTDLYATDLEVLMVSLFYDWSSIRSIFGKRNLGFFLSVVISSFETDSLINSSRYSYILPSSSYYSSSIELLIGSIDLFNRLDGFMVENHSSSMAVEALA